MDGGAWWATVHRVAKSWTQLSDSTAHGNVRVNINYILSLRKFKFRKAICPMSTHRLKFGLV